MSTISRSVKLQILVMMFFYCTNMILQVKCKEITGPIPEGAVQKGCGTCEYWDQHWDQHLGLDI
jgi:hypothetical protein